MPTRTADSTLWQCRRNSRSGRATPPILTDLIFGKYRSGANGNIAAELVARASPDGYTLLLVNAANTINATLYPQLNFDFIRDIAPVASIASGPLVMEVNPSVPAKTVPEFIEFIRANPGKINMGSAGTATVTLMVRR